MEENGTLFLIVLAGEREILRGPFNNRDLNSLEERKVAETGTSESVGKTQRSHGSLEGEKLRWRKRRPPTQGSFLPFWGLKKRWNNDKSRDMKRTVLGKGKQARNLSLSIILWGELSFNTAVFQRGEKGGKGK